MKRAYSKMTEVQLNAALCAAGIDPDRTIQAVLALVREKMQKEGHRRAHHLCRREDRVAAKVVVRTLDSRNRFHGPFARGWRMGSKAA